METDPRQSRAGWRGFSFLGGDFADQSAYLEGASGKTGPDRLTARLETGYPINITNSSLDILGRTVFKAASYSRANRLIALSCIVLHGGCGGGPTVERVPTFPVEGQVRLDGQPLGSVLVVFHPVGASGRDAIRSYARTGVDGRFRLSTFEKEDGAPAGSYVVTLVRQEENPDESNMFPQYASADASPLRTEIRPQPTQLKPFDLVSP